MAAEKFPYRKHKKEGPGRATPAVAIPCPRGKREVYPTGE